MPLTDFAGDFEGGMVGRGALIPPPPRDPRVVSALTPCLFHHVQPRTLLIIFRLEFGANFFNSLTLLIMFTLQFCAQ